MPFPGIYGSATATTTAAPIGATTQNLDYQVTIRAVSIGTHSVAIGNNSSIAAGNGFVLYGNDSVTIPVGFFKASNAVQANMAGLYVISDTGSQAIAWAGE